MVPPFDVFSVTDGDSKWLGSAETIAKALEFALKNGDGSYFVFSEETGHKNFYEVTARAVAEVAPKQGGVVR